MSRLLQRLVRTIQVSHQVLDCQVSYTQANRRRNPGTPLLGLFWGRESASRKQSLDIEWIIARVFINCV